MAMEHFLLVAEYCTLLAPISCAIVTSGMPASKFKSLWLYIPKAKGYYPYTSKLRSFTHYTRIGVSLARIRLAILCVALMHDPVTMNKSRSCTLHLKTFSCS
ncbi:unnamed protein product [Fusarium fujikuroi]|nr:unnamed protein product [Fusarium fujikuroi]